jgi:hypothetical protein
MWIAGSIRSRTMIFLFFETGDRRKTASNKNHPSHILAVFAKDETTP